MAKKKRVARRQSLGDPDTGLMTAEQLEIHRELQFIRAAGFSASTRRSKRRESKKVLSRSELSNWAERRSDKLKEVEDGR